MSTNVSLLLVGTELLDGRLSDTNGSFLIGELNQRSYAVQETLSCRDHLADICHALSHLLARCDVVIISGGIGPTSDDLTREAVAEFLGARLVLNAQCLSALKARYLERKRHFDPANTKQALFPEHASIIENQTGTAAGFYLQTGKNKAQYIFSLPGVPSELKLMFQQAVLPILESRFPVETVPKIHVFRIFGLPESHIGRIIQECHLPESIEVSYRAMFPEVQVLLKTNQKEVELGIIANQVATALDRQFIFSEDLTCNFESTLHRILLQRSISIAVAESCTGGTVGKLLTNTPGSSAYFKGGAITYSNEAKVAALGVSQQILEQHGAVSHLVAQLMAKGVKKVFRSDLALSVTGIAGPEGGSATKPVGTFFIGLASKDKTESFEFFYSSSRHGIRTYSAYIALDLVRRHLLGLPLDSLPAYRNSEEEENDS